MTLAAGLMAVALSWPAWLTYALVALLVGVESIGVPLPGETVLIAGLALSLRSGASETPFGIFLAAVIGGVIGDNVAYYVGHRYGDRLLHWLDRRWPHEFSEDRVAYAKHIFQQRGDWAVFFGRFVALLRMLSGLLAGSLHLPYRRFFVANVAAVIVWAGGITLLTAWLGSRARGVLDSLGWVVAAIVIVVVVAALRWMRESFDKRAARYAARTQASD